MTEKFSFFIIILLGVILSACNSGTSSIAKKGKFDVIELDVSEKADVPVTDFIESEKQIILETNDSCLIGEVNKIQISNDTIYLQSKREILVFSPDGKWISSFNNQGQGPREYLSITSMRVHKGIIYILDRTSRKIVAYNHKGEFLKSWKLDYLFVDFFIPDDDHFVLASAYYNPSKYQFIWINSHSGETESKFGHYIKDCTISFYTSIPFAGMAGNELVVNTPFNYSNYKMTEEKFDPYLTFDFNTEDKIPDIDPEEIDIEKMVSLTDPKIEQTLKLFMGVEHLSYFTSTETAYYLSFYLTSIRGGGHKNIVKLDKYFNQIGNLQLGFKYFDKYPYFQEYNYIWDGKIVSVRYAETLLENDEDLGLSYWKSKGLNEESNPVVLIWTLK